MRKRTGRIIRGCSYAYARQRDEIVCLLGWYGGLPSEENCRACVEEKRNNPDAKLAADAKADRAHPAHRRRISGCCDRADQA
jgi:hypothetical protein